MPAAEVKAYVDHLNRTIEAEEAERRRIAEAQRGG
jgi:hypothetical protein